ncbi:MAG: phosphoglucosamine mutase [Actinomycetota bacterium]|nr:phosphoglucosamine mutase [Actinomycetota bacterium]
MALSFGTDGVRGVAFEQLTETFVQQLGRAAGEVLGLDRWVVGRDTRESGPRLLSALAAGAARSGVEIVDLGVAPTPVVAHLAALEGCGGAMISASHNPWMDNGIKLFADGGLKLSDAQQSAIQALLDTLGETSEGGSGRDAAGVAVVAAHDDPFGSYRRCVADSIEGRNLDGLGVVLDCANGSASPIAASIFAELGADVVALNDEPDGRNINADCGSTHPERLQAAVVEHGADLGLAFDGDADRLIAVDSRGGLVDGDRIMALFAVDFKERDMLAADTLVVTVMSNLGLRRAMQRAGVNLHETPVGDRHVLEALDRGGFDLGGEQSGHLIFRRLATTGDGILSGLMFADLVHRSVHDSADLAASVMHQYPQVLVNVRVGRRPADVRSELADDVVAIEEQLGDDGRVLVRASGTEPLIRVMVEATTDVVAQAAADRLAAVVAERFV